MTAFKIWAVKLYLDQAVHECRLRIAITQRVVINHKIQTNKVGDTDVRFAQL